MDYPVFVNGDLCNAKVTLYCLFDKSRNLFINPLPIDESANAEELFCQLLHSDGTYAYKGFNRFDLYIFGSYRLADGHFEQVDGKPQLLRKGTDCILESDKME